MSLSFGGDYEDRCAENANMPPPEGRYALWRLSFRFWTYKSYFYSLDREVEAMKKFMSLVTMVGILLFVVPSSGANQSAELELIGIEVAIGVDIGDTRYGTKFTGKVMDDGEQVGYFSCTLHFQDYSNIEQCGETNNIVWLRMSLVFTDGEYQGKKLVLGMRDPTPDTPDVFWFYDTDEECEIGGCDCSCPPGDVVECYGNDASIARIGGDTDTEDGIMLKPRWGSSYEFMKKVKNASLTGYLCHHYPIVPRVSGTLVLTGE